MTRRKVETVVENKEHSFEDVLGVPKGTTEMTTTKVSSDLEAHEEYDNKDIEIEEDFVDVQDKALELFEYLMTELEDSDPNKRSRLAEVAGKVLDTALNASDKRRVLKEHIDKLTQKERQLVRNPGGKGKSNNFLMVGTHEEMMKMLREASDGTDNDVVDSTAEIIEHNEEEN